MAVMMVPSQISIIGFYRFMLDLKLIDAFPYVFIIVVLTILQVSKSKTEERRAKVHKSRITGVFHKIKGGERPNGRQCLL